MRHRIKKGECVVTHTDEERKALGFGANFGAHRVYCTSDKVMHFEEYQRVHEAGAMRTIKYADFMAREFAEFIKRENGVNAYIEESNRICAEAREAEAREAEAEKLTDEAFDIDIYVPKGDIEGFPVEVVKWMLREQEAQGNKRNTSVFELCRVHSYAGGGFDWDTVKEFNKADAEEIIMHGNFGLFFEKYPKSTDASDVLTGAKAEREITPELREAGKKLLTEARKAMGVPKEPSYIITGAPTENFLLTSLRADVKRMLEIAEAKNHDYGGKDSNPFANFMAVEHLGAASAEAGITVRMTDNLSRIITLLNKGAKVTDESITDTLLDLANYALILKALIAYKKQSVGTAVH